MLYLGCVLLILIGFIHSYFGEKYILIRLFRRDNIPKLYGSDWFTKRVLRFAWHITTIAWWGFAAILFILANQNDHVERTILIIISVVFFTSGLISGGFSKGKHLSWIVFFAIAGLSLYQAYLSPIQIHN